MSKKSRLLTLLCDDNLLQICLKLHMSNTGSSDPLNVHEQQRLYNILLTARDTWEKPVHNYTFDIAVYNLICVTIDECRDNFSTGT